MKSKKLHTRKELWRVRGLIKKRADGGESLRRQYETQLEKQIWGWPQLKLIGYKPGICSDQSGGREESAKKMRKML